MIWLSETYLDSSYAGDDTRLNLKDFTLIGADNPRNCKIGGVSINFKKHLAVLSISPLSYNECLVLKSNIQNKKGYAPCTDRLVKVRMSLISFFWILSSIYLTE